MINIHIHCGGELTIQKAGNLREYDIYFCDKCRKVVKVFTAPAYDEYVSEGYIKKPAVYYFIINMPKLCQKCGIINYMNENKCRGCGAKPTAKLPKPRTITETGKFGL